MNAIWYRKHLISYLLWPISLIYQLVIFARSSLYRLGLKGKTYFPVPVIVVGNLTVGGTGKTPLVIAIVHWLKAQGYRPGIVSRGYGGVMTKTPQPVHSDSDPKQVGDEPLLIVQKTQCPMFVAKDRVAAVSALLQEHDCHVVVSDDGLQHLALGRQVEIVVIDGDRRFGNGFCLPAGPLREPATRLKTVDLKVSNGAAAAGEWSMRLKFGKIYSITHPGDYLLLPELAGKVVHAVAGIGHPERFFSALDALGIRVIPHAFPDHHHFQKQDIDYGQEAMIIMTEKDAVKCQTFADKRHWSLPITAELDQAFFRQLMRPDMNSG